MVLKVCVLICVFVLLSQEDDSIPEEMIQDWGPILLDNSQLAIDDSEVITLPLFIPIGKHIIKNMVLFIL